MKRNSIAPAGTPRSIIDERVGQIGKLAAVPAMRERFAAVALEPIAGSTPESFAGYIKTEADRWQRSSEARVPNWNSPPV
jgi:tripartite-type tricarboxylate transporter receptor subunit TctC